MTTNDWNSSIPENLTKEEGNENKKDETQISNDIDEIKSLKKELKKTKEELEKITALAKQALADFQNFKKRNEEEKKDFIQFSTSHLIAKLLPIMDNFHLAINHLPEEKSAQEWAIGITATIKQFEDILKEQGVKEIIATDQIFNPEYHEAISVQNGKKDIIIKVLDKGYKQGERVLRRSKVIVGNGNENKEKNN